MLAQGEDWHGDSDSVAVDRAGGVGFGFLTIYPMAAIWPAGWSWHEGSPASDRYFMMIVGVYATLGLFLIRAAANPAAHKSLIWFTVWSSLVHAGIMAAQALGDPMHREHLYGDVPALFGAGVILAILMWRNEAAAAEPA